MDPSQISRLREQQGKGLQQTEEQIQQWEKYKADYVDLKDRLKKLPDKVSQEIMVPFGSQAFMPGKLVHTNEILVLLGDNWFAERSAKQACEIIDRRLQAVETQLKDFFEQKKLLESRIDFTSELQGISTVKQDVFEITEDYDEEKEKLWREQHNENVKAYKKQQLKEKSKYSKEAVKNYRTDDDVWARLAELELQERVGHEMARLDEDNSTSPAVNNEENTAILGESIKINLKQSESNKKSGKQNTHKVHWEDDNQDSGTESEDESSLTSDLEDEEEHGCKIVFHHSPREETKDGATGPAIVEPGIVQSPGDIYKTFYHPISILKQAINQTDVRKTTETMPKDVREKVIVPGAQSAFSGEIMERSNKGHDLKEPPLETVQPHKPVSRFKQRQQASKR